MDNDELNNLKECSEIALPLAERDGSDAKSPSPVAPAGTEIIDPQSKPKAKRQRKPRGKGKADKSTRVDQTTGPSRSRHLSRLKPIEMGVMLLISLLHACQIPGRSLDPERVRLYREMLDTQFPPNIIVIRDRNGKYYIASGHHRVASLLAAGYLEVKCDVYEGVVMDAIIVGGEENQGSVPMSMAARKSLLDTLLSLEDDQKYTINEMAAMTGLNRHTVSTYMEKRNAGGDFIAVASKMKRDKSPEEQLYDAAKGMVKNIKKHGVDVIVKALELMQPYLREEVLAKITPENEA